MNILIVSQYFWPESFRINDLVAGLSGRGHGITVLTAVPNYPGGKFFKGYGLFRNTAQQYQGARVVRVPIIPRGKGRGPELFLNYLSFVASACLLAPFRCRDPYDLIFIFEPSPITVALPALLLKRLRGKPVMFWVQDLWPESLTATGAVRSGWILDKVAAMVRFIYRRCDKILISSGSFRESVLQHAGDPEKIAYFPPSAEEVYQPVFQRPQADLVENLPAGFRVMFAGNIGAAQDFRTLITAAGKLNPYKDIHWLIVGEGRLRSWAEGYAAELGLRDNVHFLGRHPLEAMPAYFASADALLVSLRKEPIFAQTVPSKVQSYLASGRPVIAALDGEGAELILEAGAGFSCPAGDADLLAQAVLKMYRSSKAEREQMGRNGRTFYESNFGREMLLDKLELWMQELVPAAGKEPP